MNELPKKKTSAWKIVGIVVGVIVVSIVALVIWATAAGSRKFKRMEERSQAHLAEVKAADPRRPALRGTAEPGNAWDDYALAVAEVKKFGKIDKLGQSVSRDSKADPAIAKEALEGHGAAIDHLRRGAGRASSRYPYQWEQGSRMQIPSMADYLHLSNFAVLKARALLDEGKARDGAGVLLDHVQFARDVGADGMLITYMVGMGLFGTALNEIHDQLVAGRFDKAALEDLDRGLETLDGSFPSYGKVLLNEALLFGGFIDESVAGSGPGRWMIADAAERVGDSMAAAAKTESLPWAEAQKEMARIEAEALKGWNPLSRIATPSMARTDRVGRQRRAQLRALRMAVHAEATGKMLDLDDPFGVKMRTDGKLRIWSVGEDGIDDGGTGGWKAASKDVVLELKK